MNYEMDVYTQIGKKAEINLNEQFISPHDKGVLCDVPGHTWTLA